MATIGLLALIGLFFFSPRTAIFIGLLVLLAACGGGGGGQPVADEPGFVPVYEREGYPFDYRGCYIGWILVWERLGLTPDEQVVQRDALPPCPDTLVTHND